MEEQTKGNERQGRERKRRKGNVTDDVTDNLHDT